jgi:hypothetical protein
MAQPETLAKVKLAIRRSHNKLDDDLMADIDACLADLRAHGITGPKAVETDPLIYNAIKLYCRALDASEPAAAEEWRGCYKDLRDNLKVAKGYGWAEEVAGND